MQNLKGNSLLNSLNWELKLELLKSHSCSEFTHTQKLKRQNLRQIKLKKTKDIYI